MCNATIPADSLFCDKCGVRDPCKQKRPIDRRLLLIAAVAAILILGTVAALRIFPQPTPTPAPTPTPIPAVGQTVSQGGLNITLSEYRRDVPYTEIPNGTPQLKYYLINTTWSGKTYWDPSNRIKESVVWSDGNVSTRDLLYVPGIPGSAYNESTYVLGSNAWLSVYFFEPTAYTAYPTQFQLRVPTATGGVSNFTWSLPAVS